jgi:hypothetical protein
LNKEKHFSSLLADERDAGLTEKWEMYLIDSLLAFLTTTIYVSAN